MTTYQMNKLGWSIRRETFFGHDGAEPVYRVYRRGRVRPALSENFPSFEEALASARTAIAFELDVDPGELDAHLDRVVGGPPARRNAVHRRP